MTDLEQMRTVYPLGNALARLHGKTVLTAEWDRGINWLTVKFTDGTTLECCTSATDNMIFAVCEGEKEYWSDVTK